MTTLREQIEAGSLQLTISKHGNLIAFEIWECQTCSGTGLVNDDECEECGGTGEVLHKIASDDSRWGELQQIAAEMKLEPDSDEEE